MASERVFRYGEEFWRVNADDSLDVRVGVNGEWQRKGFHVREHLLEELARSHNRLREAFEAFESAQHRDRELGTIIEALVGKPLPESGRFLGRIDID